MVHRKTGLLLASDQPLALADALSELERQPDLRTKMGEAARLRAERLFDRRVNVARLDTWFERSSRGKSLVDNVRILRAVER